MQWEKPKKIFFIPQKWCWPFDIHNQIYFKKYWYKMSINIVRFVKKIYGCRLSGDHNSKNYFLNVFKVGVDYLVSITQFYCLF